MVAAEVGLVVIVSAVITVLTLEVVIVVAAEVVLVTEASAVITVLTLEVVFVVAAAWKGEGEEKVKF